MPHVHVMAACQMSLYTTGTHCLVPVIHLHLLVKLQERGVHTDTAPRPGDASLQPARSKSGLVQHALQQLTVQIWWLLHLSHTTLCCQHSA